MPGEVGTAWDRSCDALWCVLCMAAWACWFAKGPVEAEPTYPACPNEMLIKCMALNGLQQNQYAAACGVVVVCCLRCRRSLHPLAALAHVFPAPALEDVFASSLLVQQQ